MVPMMNGREYNYGLQHIRLEGRTCGNSRFADNSELVENAELVENCNSVHSAAFCAEVVRKMRENVDTVRSKSTVYTVSEDAELLDKFERLTQSEGIAQSRCQLTTTAKPVIMMMWEI